MPKSRLCPREDKGSCLGAWLEYLIPCPVHPMFGLGSRVPGRPGVKAADHSRLGWSPRTGFDGASAYPKADLTPCIPSIPLLQPFAKLDYSLVVMLLMRTEHRAGPQGDAHPTPSPIQSLADTSLLGLPFRESLLRPSRSPSQPLSQAWV